MFLFSSAWWIRKGLVICGYHFKLKNSHLDSKQFDVISKPQPSICRNKKRWTLKKKQMPLRHLFISGGGTKSCSFNWDYWSSVLMLILATSTKKKQHWTSPPILAMFCFQKVIPSKFYLINDFGKRLHQLQLVINGLILKIIDNYPTWTWHRT